MAIMSARGKCCDTSAILEVDQMVLRWSDVEKTAKPGTYKFLDGAVKITTKHIDIWTKNPEARFKLTAINLMAGRKHYAIGTVECD